MFLLGVKGIGATEEDAPGHVDDTQDHRELHLEGRREGGREGGWAKGAWSVGPRAAEE